MNIRFLDHEHWWEKWIVCSICNISWDSYKKNHNVIGFILQENLSKIESELIKAFHVILSGAGYQIEDIIFYDVDDVYVGCQIFALLLIENKLPMSEKVKDLVLKSIDWSCDGLRGWDKNREEIRKKVLIDFEKVITDYNLIYDSL